jgi:hypothetical protein
VCSEKAGDETRPALPAELFQLVALNLAASSRHAAAKSAKRFFVSCFLVVRVAPVTDEIDPPRQFSLLASLALLAAAGG